MPQLPVVLWIVLAIIPVVIGFLLLVEAKVVRPSIEAERHAEAPEAGRPERSPTAEPDLRRSAG